MYVCMYVGFSHYCLPLLLLCMDMVMVESSPQEGGFNVVEFGAVGNGKTDDSEVKKKKKNYSYTYFHVISRP